MEAIKPKGLNGTDGLIDRIFLNIQRAVFQDENKFNHCLSFFFWSLCCLSFLDLWILNTTLISSNISSIIFNTHVHKWGRNGIIWVTSLREGWNNLDNEFWLPLKNYGFLVSCYTHFYKGKISLYYFISKKGYGCKWTWETGQH